MRSVCRRRRSRSPVAAAGAAAPVAWLLKVSIGRTDVDGVRMVGPLEVGEGPLPWCYGPSEESLFEWVAFLHTDLIDSTEQEAAEWFLDYRTSPMY